MPLIVLAVNVVKAPVDGAPDPIGLGDANMVVRFDGLSALFVKLAAVTSVFDAYDTDTQGGFVTTRLPDTLRSVNLPVDALLEPIGIEFAKMLAKFDGLTILFVRVPAFASAFVANCNFTLPGPEGTG